MMDDNCIIVYRRVYATSERTTGIPAVFGYALV